jgi:hypothetical protein
MLVMGAVALVVLVVVLLLGMTVLQGITDGLGASTTAGNVSSEPDPTAGQPVSFADTAGDAEVQAVYDVRDSRGYGVALTGAPDSEVAADADFTVASDDTWTVATWAAVNSSATGETMTALSADGRVLIQYNGSASEWQVWYYDENGRDSYRVTVAAPSPTDYTWVAAHHDGTTLTIYRNTTAGGSTSTTADSITSARTTSSNWHGRLDETRTFDDALTSSQRAALVADPVGPLENGTRTARIMYDQGQGTSTPIYFADTGATVSNASWVGGLDGQSLTAGTDYTIDEGAGTITALAGGRLEGAPVVFIDYRYLGTNAVGEVATAISGTLGVFGAAALLIPAVAVLAVLVVALAASPASLPGIGGRNRRGPGGNR